ncbi:MAG: hypothetical protein WDN28_31215 [Chthoniobacter sp.]
MNTHPTSLNRCRVTSLALALGLAGFGVARAGDTAPGWLLVTNKADQTLSIVDPATNQQIATMPEGGQHLSRTRHHAGRQARFPADLRGFRRRQARHEWAAHSRGGRGEARDHGHDRFRPGRASALRSLQPGDQSPLRHHGD